MRDPYLYQDIDVLRNKYGIKSQKDADEMESEYTGWRLKQIAENPLQGNYDFQHLCDFHKWIFQDMYDWAGAPRTIDIEKSEPVLGGISVEYAKVSGIKDNAAIVLNKMKSIQWDKLNLNDKAMEFSKCMADLWKVHCFREGNTRTVITFCCQYAESKGIILDRTLFSENSMYVRNSLVAASAKFSDLGDKSNLEYLIRIVKDSIEKGNESNKSVRKKLECCKKKATDKAKIIKNEKIIENER